MDRQKSNLYTSTLEFLCGIWSKYPTHMCLPGVGSDCGAKSETMVQMTTHQCTLAADEETALL